MTSPLSGREAALLALGTHLKQAGYNFTTPTPATIARVNGRAGSAPAADLRDVFGWNRRFAPGLLDGSLIDLMRAADALDETAPLWRSRLRAATLGADLYLHSAFPTDAPDAVFFGPDSYRFVRFIAASLPILATPPRRLLDIGCGTGVGGLSAQAALGGTTELVLTDINPAALSLARVNAALAGHTTARTIESDVGAALDGTFDLIMANPPYMMDPQRRTYRDGGGLNGAGLSLRILHEALALLNPGGCLVLYTGVGIEAGRDHFREAALDLLEPIGARLRYEELDPDVFGDELDTPNYRSIERIAVIGLTVSI
jgi:SAM-dependent methyltransferase